MRLSSTYFRRFTYSIAAISASAIFSHCEATDLAIQAPNVVAISPLLVSSGQPNVASLKHLAQLGFDAVIYLAPTTVSDAVLGEAEIIRAQGMEFIHIPIQFGKPTSADVESFFAAMRHLQGKKVLVHCQVNMRASSLIFLYRSIIQQEKPELAYEAVSKIWSPSGPWKKLIIDQLQAAGIHFDPY